jgi:outer membrane protein TolC
MTRVDTKATLAQKSGFRRRLVRLVALALVGAGFAACKSAGDHRRDADREVYELVEARRAELHLGDPRFSIEPDPSSLRQRLLRGEATGAESISLVQTLEIAAENSREYQSQKEELYLAALDLTLERWNFSIQENGSLSTAAFGVGDLATADAGGSFGLSKLFGTGAKIVGDIGLGLTRSLSRSDGWNPIADVGLTITQPLLRGFGEDIVKEPLTQAERDLVYAVRSFERFRRTFAFDVAERYYEQLQRLDAVKNQEANFKNLKELSDRNAELTKAGRLSDIEAGQARQNELRSGNQLLEAREGLEFNNDQFKLFLGLPTKSPLVLDPGELVELAQQDLRAIELDEDLATAFALAHRLDHLNTIDAQDDAKRRVAVAKDRLRAELTPTLRYASVNSDGEPADLRFDNSIWSVEAELKLPFDRLPERNAYRQSLIDLDVAVREADRSADEVRAELRDSLRRIDTRREGWEIQLAAVALAERRIESTQLSLEAGRASTRDLLEAQESLLSAQNAATSALIDYTLAKLGLYLDMELLRVDERGVTADELPVPAAPAPDAPTAEAPEPEAEASQPGR